MRNVLNKMSFDLYMLLVLGLTFFSYTGHITAFYFPIIIIIAIFGIIYNKGIMQIIALGLFSQMSFSGMRDNTNVTILYTCVLTTIILADIIKNRKLTKFGYLSLPILILSGLSLVTGINGISLYATMVGFFQIFSTFMLYIYFVNTLDDKDDLYIKMSKMFMYMGLLVTFEMIYYIYETEELLIDVIRNRTITLGWENLNVIIFANIVSIPLMGYLVLKSKIKLPYMLFALINVLGILMTLSRSSILSLAVYLVLLIPLIIYFEKNRMSLLIQGLIFLAFVSIGFYILESYDIISDYYSILTDRDLTNYDDRLVLLQVAWEQFKMHPIIGSGGIFSSRYHIADAGYAAINYHNTIAQVSALGIFGLVGFIFLVIRKIKLMLLTKDSYKWFILILLFVTAFINGSLQPMYFYTTYMIYLFMILASIEVTET